ncbi:hypothetical protein E4665_12270 [Sporolactobacillus shoreae]|uniref:Uncharacterized protein n=1 Tax=Sporolactobacillus shoreae TaxID=1465501 RepID=A0A4Z0GNA4_9BACL|nr:DUF6516 family protein [Sporolactobacillus shoreae]TGA97394.1 hypothetical protein E4665_12270 [Sporolactobacillus shoreae]
MPSLSDYGAIISRYSTIFRQPPSLILNENELKITLYFITSFYGETQLRVREWFDSDDKKIRYRYCWERNNSHPGHISAWENEHDHDGLQTNPHHHHYVPGNRHQVQNNYNVRDLESALSVVKDYLLSNLEYDGKEI